MPIHADILTPLADALAELYPDQASARVLALSAGLKLGQIPFDARASNTWILLLAEAEAQGRTQPLLDRAAAQYASYEPLVTAGQAYADWVTAGRPMTAPAHAPRTPWNATPPSSGKIKILFLAANPSDTTRLRVDEEVRAIDQSLRLAEYRDAFILEQAHAVRVADLQSLLLRHQPHVVHFSGHGSPDGKIILENERGQAQTVLTRALSTVFSVLKDNIRCVVLNACYSQEQAKAIADSIDCVVGMSTAIGDPAALSFASAFYQALGFGRTIKTAFDLGCNQIDLANLDEQDTPQLLAVNVAPDTVILAR